MLSGAGYLVYRLTGEATLDIYDAGAYAPLLTCSTLAWNPDMAELLHRLAAAAPDLDMRHCRAGDSEAAH